MILNYAPRKAIGKEFTLSLYDDASLIDALKEIDNRTKDKFPIENYPEYKSLLHIIWNPKGPKRGRFYKNIGIHPFYLRQDPWSKLPDNLTVQLITGFCKSEAEPLIPYEKFLEKMKKTLK